MQGLVNSCWSCFKWGLLLSLIGGLVAVPYFYHRVDEEIRLRVEAKLLAHYPGLAVSVRFAKLVEGEGIEIRGISILDPGVSGPPAELAYIDEMFLACDTQLQELVGSVPNVRQIVIRRPRIRMTRQDDGAWSAARLWPPPRLSERPADVLIEGGVVEIFDPWKPTPSPFTLRDLVLNVTHKLAAPAAATPDLPQRLEMHFRGELTADYLRSLSLEGLLEPAGGHCEVRGAAEGLDFSPELVAALPSEVSEPLAALASLRAQVKLTYHVEHNSAVSPDPRFQVISQVSRGRIDDPRLPYPLTDLRATVTCDQHGFRVQDLIARNGHTNFKLSCQRQGYKPDSPVTLQVEGRQMVIDRQIFDVLPAEWQKVWYKFMPVGEIDATAKLAFDGQRWIPDLDVKLLNVSFLYDEFPYRLERGSGLLQLKQGVLTLDTTAFSAGDEVRVTAQVHDPGPAFTGRIDIVAPTLRLDDKLISAMKDKPREIFQSLNPRGTVSCRVRCFRNDARDPLVHKEAWGRFNRCSMSYDKFPYPLANIQGDFSFVDGAWQFTNLEGTNDTGLVTCNGGYTPLATGGELLLRFTGTNVPLEEELRDALDSKAQRLWDMLRPRGAFDLPMLEVRYFSGQKRPEIVFRLEPRTGATNTSIEPTVFPYRMERLRGSLLVRDGQVEIQHLRAEHGRTQLATKGTSSCTPEGQWRLTLQDLTVDRLRLDADLELIAALPERLRKALAPLDPRGPMYLSGLLEFLGHCDAPGRTETNWNLALEMMGGSLDAGIKLENLQGGVHLAGGFDGERLQCRGDMNFDSLTYRNYQLTEVKGPLWIDDAQVMLGEPAQPGRLARPATARLYGGTLSGDCWVGLSGTPRYSVRAEMRNVDLARYTQESLVGRQDLRGKVQANVELSGMGRGSHTLRGRGSVKLRDADIYELPLMVALLKILSVRPPDTTAFTASDTDFHVEGGHVYFDKINFIGDAISLMGNGEMDFDNQIDLTFHAAVGRGDLPIPIIGALAKNASQQFMKITVVGTVDSPVTKAEAFPGVNQAFKDLEAGLQTGDKRRTTEAR